MGSIDDGAVAMRGQVSDETMAYHLSLLSHANPMDDTAEGSLAPIFTGSMLPRDQKSDGNPQVHQFGLLAGLSDKLSGPVTSVADDPRLFFNVTAPSSTFICGSQGSGKSHTLSCILENCLISSQAGRLPSPLGGVVFHYDTFISDSFGSPCEAAFLSSHPDVEVRVLCSPTNVHTIQACYSRFNISVTPLQIDQRYLNTKRMMDLMAVGQDDGPMPLYMHTVQRVLREMRIVQQRTQTGFDYQEFKRRMRSSNLTPAQLEPLSQRLATLESFMSQPQGGLSGGKEKSIPRGTDWKSKPRRLTVVDLSCPCISPETACSLFNICLGIFLEQDPCVGKVVALDEAHKYMNRSIEARGFTETLLSAVRLQRHLGVRMIISTQEPTISTALLNLCSVTIVHRFSSPEWLRALHKHIAGAAGAPFSVQTESDSAVAPAQSLFNQIVDLRVGEALIFAPSAIVGEIQDDGQLSLRRLGHGSLRVQIRNRLTTDGGRSVLA
ncbi:hypothetical protein AWENTII_009229 [Aspergillus wentii]